MGCDIHCVIEYKEAGSQEWTSFGSSSISPGRNYGWFSELAGVRGSPKDKPLATGFGLPEDVSYITRYETSLIVCDNPQDIAYYGTRVVTQEQAEAWVKAGTSKFIPTTVVSTKVNRKITHPDYHSYGWCNPKDWKKSTRGRNWVELKCMNAILDTIVKMKLEARVVFWFDN